MKSRLVWATSITGTPHEAKIPPARRSIGTIRQLGGSRCSQDNGRTPLVKLNAFDPEAKRLRLDVEVCGLADGTDLQHGRGHAALSEWTDGSRPHAFFAQDNLRVKRLIGQGAPNGRTRAP